MEGTPMPKRSNTAESAPLPSTLKRSPKKAAETYEATLASAEKTYDGDEARAHRAAWAAVKHSYEKTGDRWTEKAKKGPSDERAAHGGPEPAGRSYGGVDFLGKKKADLLAEARRRELDVTTKMTKADLAEALSRSNTRATRKRRDA